LKAKEIRGENLLDKTDIVNIVTPYCGTSVRTNILSQSETFFILSNGGSSR